jgi:hypothetical protein
MMRGLAPLFFSFILDFHIDIVNMDKRNEHVSNQMSGKEWSI